MDEAEYNSRRRAYADEDQNEQSDDIMSDDAFRLAKENAGLYAARLLAQMTTEANKKGGKAFGEAKSKGHTPAICETMARCAIVAAIKDVLK